MAGLAGRLDEAERAVSDELARAQNGRQRINALCCLGAVRVDCAQPEGACAAIGDAADSARPLGYAPGIWRVGTLRQRMDPAWNDLDCVRELDERLRAGA